VKTNKRMLAIAAALPLLVTGCAISKGGSSAYPNKPIQLIVPFAPGGATDTFARLVANYVQSHSDAKVQVVNKEGAGGLVGTYEVLESQPDGSELVATADSSTLLNFAMNQKGPYAASGLGLVARVSLSPVVLIVKAGSPYKTAGELLNAVKKNPTQFKVGTSSLAGPSTFGVGALLSADGINPSKPKLVVLNSGASVVTAVAGGQVDFAAQLAPDVEELVKGGKVRALAVSSSTPLASLGNTPTGAAAGIPSFNEQSVSGIAGPKNLPKNVIDFWQSMMQKATSDPSFMAQLAQIGSVPAYQSAAGYQTWNESAISHEAEVAKSLGIS
jgi:tripartite-type tricarboxylate transporter receptor subunit TctC